MKNIVIIDQFYSDPHAVRELALSCEWIDRSNLPDRFPGTESEHSFFTDAVVQKIEKAVGKKIEVDPETTSFGVFARASDADAGKNPVHIDHTEWAGVLYLSKNEQGGTNFYCHKRTGHREVPGLEELHRLDFKDREDYRQKVVVPDQYNPEAWELDVKVGMKFNRMVLFRAGHLFHAAANYYGRDEETERLLQLFFFNTREN